MRGNTVDQSRFSHGSKVSATRRKAHEASLVVEIYLNKLEGANELRVSSLKGDKVVSHLRS